MTYPENDGNEYCQGILLRGGGEEMGEQNQCRIHTELVRSRGDVLVQEGVEGRESGRNEPMNDEIIKME